MPSTPSYLDPAVIQKISRLEVRARLVVEGFITGLHKSPYHGYAVEFVGHREYVPGDEIKHLDWKVWARADRFYIKEYEEETNLNCTILLDCSKSMAYGGLPGASQAPVDTSAAHSKFAYAATAAACLAYLIQRQQDAVGLVSFANSVRRNLPASTHPSHLRLLLRELAETQPEERTDVGAVFRQLVQQPLNRGLVVLISDLFVDPPTLRRSLQRLRHLRHEVVVWHVLHADEITFPFQDNTLFRGLEQDVELLTEPRALRQSYLAALERFRGDVRRTCAAAGIDYVSLNTAEPLDAALAAYLAQRQRTMRGVRRK